MEEAVSFDAFGFFWCVAVAVFVALCPVFLFPRPNHLEGFAGPLVLLEMVERRGVVAVFVVELLEVVGDESFEEIPSAYGRLG